MLKTNEITEDMVRKYAKAEIVHALDESIKSYKKWGMMNLEALDPDYTEEQVKDVERAAHNSAMFWLKRKYYELYSLSPTEPEQIETYKRLHQMEIESSLDNLMGEPVKEVELMQI
jgi:hypothetical protein